MKIVRRVLNEAGFVENLTYRETRFLKPPRETYAVFLDSYNRRGSDDRNFITEHEYDIELYSYAPDPEAEKRIEEAFDKFGIAYSKEDRYWIQEEQLYQTIYSFPHIEK